MEKYTSWTTKQKKAGIAILISKYTVRHGITRNKEVHFMIKESIQQKFCYVKFIQILHCIQNELEMDHGPKYKSQNY